MFLEQVLDISRLLTENIFIGFIAIVSYKIHRLGLRMLQECNLVASISFCNEILLRQFFK